MVIKLKKTGDLNSRISPISGEGFKNDSIADRVEGKL
jgi:hypothetical protein